MNMNDSFFDELEANFDFRIAVLSSSTNDGLCQAAPPPVTTIDDEITNFLIDNKSKSTVYKDISACKRLRLRMEEIQPVDKRDFTELTKTELEEIMRQFFMQAKKMEKKDMNELYQPETLNSFRNAWQRVISDKGLKMNIKIDSEFER